MEDTDLLYAAKILMDNAGLEYVNIADVLRFATLYQCRDPGRLAAVLMIRAELENRVYMRNTDAFRDDIVTRYANSPSVLLQPYRDHLDALNHARPFGTGSPAHQIAMFDVVMAVRERVEDAHELCDPLDILLGELVDSYGEDTAFYAFVRSSPASVRSRLSFTPGFIALFTPSPDQSESRSLVDWMVEGPRTPTAACVA